MSTTPALGRQRQAFRLPRNRSRGGNAPQLKQVAGSQLREEDWNCLERVEGGEWAQAASSDAVLERLRQLKLVVIRPRHGPVITGLGREALLRHKYRFPVSLEKLRAE